MRRHYSTEQYAVYQQDAAGEFWGSATLAHAARLAAVIGSRFRAAVGRLLGFGALPAQRRAGGASGQPQWLLRARLRDVGGLDSHPGAAHAKRSFLPRGIQSLERRAPEVAEMIRMAFLRGISTRAVGRVVALLTNEPVSAATVSR